MGHGYRKQKPLLPKCNQRNPVRCLELAFMRLDRRFCARMLIILLAATFIISGVLIGVMSMMGIGYIKVLFG